MAEIRLGAAAGPVGRSAAATTDATLNAQVLSYSRSEGMFAGVALDGSVLSAQVKYYPWPNIAFFVRDSVNLRGFHEENPLRSWRNQLFVGIDWDF